MKRVRTEDVLTGIAGLVLLVSLIIRADDLGVLDVWLLLTAVLGIAVLVVTASVGKPALPVAIDVLATWAAVLGLIFILVRSLGDTAWLGLIGDVGILVFAFRAMRNQSAPGLEPNPEPQLMPAPPA